MPNETPVPMEPPTGTQALLFDCDGTLVDTLGLYQICWHQTFGRYGFDMSDEWFQARVGNDLHTLIRMAFPDRDAAFRDQVIEEGMGMFFASTHLLEPLEHVVDVARRYHGRIPLAVVSGGLGHAVRESLDAVGITSLFDIIITLEDVETTKPAPDAYLLAMKMLGVDASACVAYEDSSVGMDSARAAGIATVVDVRWHQA